MQSFDTLPESLRKHIFSFFWPQMTLAKVSAIYEERGLEVELMDTHLYAFANQNQEVTVRLVDMGWPCGDILVRTGLTLKLLTIYKRLKCIVDTDTFMDYFKKKNGINSIDLWGLLVDKEREEFLETIPNA